MAARRGVHAVKILAVAQKGMGRGEPGRAKNAAHARARTRGRAARSKTLLFVATTCRLGAHRRPMDTEGGGGCMSFACRPVRFAVLSWGSRTKARIVLGGKKYFFFYVRLHGSSLTRENKLKDLSDCASCSKCFRSSLLRFRLLETKSFFNSCQTASMQFDIKEKNRICFPGTIRGLVRLLACSQTLKKTYYFHPGTIRGLFRLPPCSLK